MRLLKLSLVFLGIALCPLAPAQSSPAVAGPVVVPPHSTQQLVNRFDFPVRGRLAPYAPGSRAAMMPNGIVLMLPPLSPDLVVQSFYPDRKMNLLGRVQDNTCFKLRKYIFQPKEQTEAKGIRPLDGPMQLVGETDCTYADKVWPKPAEKNQPVRPQVGVHSTVLRLK